MRIRARMSLPRPIIPGQTVMITRRCTQRMFLLLPTAIVNNIFLYCLAVAAKRCGILIHAVCVLSNHYHLVASDPHGKRPEFYRWLHEFVAKAVNATHGRWENMWASEQTSVVELIDAEAQQGKTIYTMANPVAAALVASGDQWPGIRIGPAQLNKRIIVKRPKHFFAKDSHLPKKAQLTITKLPAFAHLSDDEYRKTLGEAIETHETTLVREIIEAGRTFLGPRRIRQQSPFATPTSPEPRQTLNPRIACTNKWARIEALSRLNNFIDNYRQAYQRWRNGDASTVFPPGTYWLRIYAGVHCAPS